MRIDYGHCGVLRLCLGTFGSRSGFYSQRSRVSAIASRTIMAEGKSSYGIYAASSLEQVEAEEILENNYFYSQEHVVN